jgi:hypothetical protein
VAPKASVNSSPEPSELPIAEIINMEKAIMKLANHDFDGAETNLRKGNSTFHMMGFGIMTLMRITLDLNKTATKASEYFTKYENMALNKQKES